MMRMASVSTGHMTALDSKLMMATERPLPPYRMALAQPIQSDETEGPGAIFYVTDMGDADIEDALGELNAHGFSPEFCAIYRLAAMQGAQYISFDRDGTIYENLPAFEW